MNMGSIIRAKRKALGFTLQEVGDVFGISRSAVASWERGDTRPDQDRLVALARKLKTSVQYLVTGEARYDLPNPLVANLTKLGDAAHITLLDDVEEASLSNLAGASNPLKELKSRVGLILTETSSTPEQLAEAAGVALEIVEKWLLGHEKTISLESAIALQQRYGYNPVWIVMGRGEPKMPEIHHEDPFNPIPIPAGRRIPVVGTAQLGDGGFWADLEYAVGHGDGYLDFPSKDKDAYGVRCKGDSMMPRIKDGEFVIVEPNRTVSNGDEVLVKAKDGRVMVKIYLYAAQGRTHLMSVNTSHADFSIDTDQIERMHYVAAIVKPSMWLFG